MGRGWVGTSVRSPDNQEGACESLKGPIHVWFWYFPFNFGVFSTIFSLFRKIIMLNMLSGHSAAQVICSIYESLPVVLLDLKFPILREVPGTPMQSWSTLQDFSWRPCSRVRYNPVTVFVWHCSSSNKYLKFGMIRDGLFRIWDTILLFVFSMIIKIILVFDWCTQIAYYIISVTWSYLPFYVIEFKYHTIKFCQFYLDWLSISSIVSS